VSRPLQIKSVDPDAVRRLARAQDLPELLATLLVARGWTDPDEVRGALAPSAMGLHDPSLLPHLDAGTERVARAVRDGETILVHGDYDVDGVTGTALLVRLLRMVGANAIWHIPNRLVDGYSFGAHSVERARETGAKVVISVDNGTSAADTIAELNAIGVDTVVTDHHEPPEGPLPEAVAIVNPKLTDSTYPWRELCGGAVAFKLAWGIARAVTGSERVSDELKRFLEEAMAYVAIATVCDVVPLRDENRILATYGLRSLEGTRNPGLAALKGVAKLNGRALTAEDVAFQIGPRINASGRLGSAETAVELLLAEDPGEAARLAARLDELNVQRKEIEREVHVAAREQARKFADPTENPVLVLAGEGWHQGVVGIVAARITEEFHRPALVIGLDGEEGRGSARSVEGADVLEILRAGAAHTLRQGGHAQAAGCEVRADAVDALREAMRARAQELAAGTDAGVPPLLVDAQLPLAELTEPLMRQIDRLEPCGAVNEKPLLVSRVHLAEPPRAIGADGTHLLMRVRDGHRALKALGFGMASRMGELEMGRPFDLASSASAAAARSFTTDTSDRRSAGSPSSTRSTSSKRRPRHARSASS
jgi:single-stranded-DNA-specific exonuclease